MHLSTKSIFILLSPFILAGILWSMSGLYIGLLASFFTSAELMKTPLIDQQGSSYEFITGHKNEFSSLIQKIQTRESNLFWISERLYQFRPHPPAPTQLPMAPALALKPPPPLLQFSQGDTTSVSPQSWSVQMVMPDQNMAIINNEIYRVGQSRGGIKLLDVTASTIHIQTPKGKQWVKLFH